MSDKEKKTLYELVGLYIAELEEDIKERYPCVKSKHELAALLTIQNHVKVLNEVRGMLVCDF